MTRPLLLALALLLPCYAWAANGFVDGMEDLPLMPQLQSAEQSNLAFDSPQGRIIVSYAQGAGAPTDVLSFYARTLPQLGWVRVTDASYRREGEQLSIETGDTHPLTVRFTLSPQRKK